MAIVDVEKVRQGILGTDAVFGKRALSYFDSRNLLFVRVDPSGSPPRGIEGHLPLDETLRTPPEDIGFQKIVYRVRISPVMGASSCQELDRVVFSINLTAGYNELDGFRGFVDKESYGIPSANLGKCALRSDWAFRIHKKFLDEMVKARDYLVINSA